MGDRAEHDETLTVPAPSDGWLVPSDVELVELVGWAPDDWLPAESMRPVKDAATDGNLGLRWGYTGQPRGKHAQMSETVLLGFSELGEAPAQRIRSFAARHGVLEICHHGLPATHHPRPQFFDEAPPFYQECPYCPGCRSGKHWVTTRQRLPYCVPIGAGFKTAELGQGWNLDQGWAPIAAWRRYAREAAAVLRFGLAVQSGLVPDADDPGWRTLVRGVSGAPYGPERADPAVDRLQHDAVAARGLVHDLVTRWLQLGAVRPALARDGTFVLSAGGLFQALAVQLLLFVSQSRGFLLCSNERCGKPYLPTGRVQGGRRHYCPACGTAAARRAASKAYRQRLREQRS